MPYARVSTLRQSRQRTESRGHFSAALRQPARRYSDLADALIDTLPGIVLLIGADGRLIRWNTNFCDLTGHSDEQLQGQDFIPHLVETCRAAAVSKLQEMFDLGSADFEADMCAKSGAPRQLQLSGRRMEYRHQICVLVTGNDVTEARKSDRLANEITDRLHTIFASVNDGIFVCDPTAGRFLEVNQSGCTMFGYSEDELIGLDIVTLSSGVAPYTQEDAIAWIGKALGGQPQIFEWHCKRKDGSLFWTEIALRCAAFGDRKMILSTVRDITARKQADEQIARMARFDALTQLSNRSVFVEAIEGEIAQLQRSGRNFAVLYIDLDHFKDINDTVGHPVGDLLLQSLAMRLRDSVRKSDVVARFGGDEFAVLARNVAELADVATLANKLLSELDKPFLIKGNEIRSAASIGITMCGPDVADAEILLSHADLALYRAKAEGRHTYRFFTDTMDAEVHAQVNLSAELREAIAKEQLFLVYQPQVASQTGEVIGVEALVRWRHPRRGVLAPGAFIQVAEKTGLIVPLGRWVLREACRQARRWLDAGIAPRTVAVNVSAIEFKAPLQLEGGIAEILAETRLPSGMLELEITETALMNTSRDYHDVLQRIRALGVKLALDDFGTGYSSLTYLRRFPVDRIKIAQDFIAELPGASNDAAIVKAAIGLAKDLAIDVIAEGIETVEQAELLDAWGCREMQGYYFSRPVPVEEVTEVLRLGELKRVEPMTIVNA